MFDYFVFLVREKMPAILGAGIMTAGAYMAHLAGVI